IWLSTPSTLAPAPALAPVPRPSVCRPGARDGRHVDAPERMASELRARTCDELGWTVASPQRRRQEQAPASSASERTAARRSPPRDVALGTTETEGRRGVQALISTR